MQKKHKIIIVPFEDGGNTPGVKQSAYNINKIVKESILIEEDTNIKNSNIKNLKNLESVLDINYKLSESVNKVYRSGQKPIIIGGDHSISLGSVSGISKEINDLGVIWIDAHGDMNTNEISPSGNIHGMILAALQGYGDERLVNHYFSGPKIRRENVLIFGTRNLDKEEKELIKSLGVKYITFKEIQEQGLEKSLKSIKNYFKNKISKLHISLDLDVLNPIISPGVSVPEQNGFNTEEVNLILDYLFKYFAVSSIDIVEYNEVFDLNNRTKAILIDLLNKIIKMVDHQ